MPKESVIKHFSSSTTGAAPTAADLVEGELAINTADERIYFENASGQVVNFGESRGISATYARIVSTVASLNGLTGARTLTGDGGAIVGVGNNTIRARLATESLTGVASFPATDFAVSSAGAVTLTGNVAKTNVAQTFTALQRFNVGLSAFENIYVGRGATSVEIAYRDISGDLPPGENRSTIIKGNDSKGLYILYGGGPTASSVSLRTDGVSIGHDGVGGRASLFIGQATRDGLPGDPVSSSRIVFSSLKPLQPPGSNIRSTSLISTAADAGDAEITLPLLSGTLALTRDVVTSLNGLTGARTLTGDGGAIVGVGNNTIRARVATASLTGVASFPATDFAVSSAGAVSVTGNFVRTVVVGGSTLTGNVSLTAGSNITLTPSGSTITIASSGGGGGGVTTTAQNTWTATQYFNAGLSATGATFTGAITGATATFGRLLTANAGISASGITANKGFFNNFDVNSTSAITISSFNSLINIACPTDTIDGGGGQVAIGDNDGVGNNTYIYVDDENYAIDLNAAVAVNINSNLNVYSNLDNYGNANFGLNVNPNNGPSVTGRNGVAIGAGAIKARTVGYNLVAADNGKVITMNSSSALTVTAGTDVGETGFSCSIIQLGAGQVTIAASGTTLNSYNGLKIAGQHGAASIVCYATNVFNVAGNLTT